MLFCAAALALSGCATTRPMPYQGIESSSYLRPNEDSHRGHQPYVYDTPVEWSRYRSFVLDPVDIYRGPDQQFEKVSEQDKQALAGYMQEQFQARLRERYAQVFEPRRDTLRIRITLTGARASTKFISTFTKMDIGGAPYNAVQAMRGREGLFTGSVSYAVEIYDAQSQRLLKAYVDKQYPNAMNMKATFGAMSAARTGIQKGADNLLQSMQ
ncbi:MULTISPECIES: DUF3313 domain-containing protein [unclassified Dyella]|uniref:DUF3313 domain-containing protein n=1 Tax=unclassified Dyella TaxID=2634549 RepID=UPI0020327E97|nr:MULTISPECIES: DUF3313 domain-containing protein [unclassified Dyella]